MGVRRREEETAPHEHELAASSVLLLDRRRLLKAGAVGLGAVLLAACDPRRAASPAASESPGTTDTPSGPLPGFDAFTDTVSTSAHDGWWWVESTGMPAHPLMVGIRSWQQQVPVPQPYQGTNAWRFPVTPVLADQPMSAAHALYRGAIALAVNGVPIFNALNNRGDDAYLAGELDQWGGHSGRADDYHYHVAPLHLGDVVGRAKPIAYALDGFALYGATEPDGSTVVGLDEFNGHSLGPWGYHYHGTTTYPYINGGMRGEVQVIGDQVDPQPLTRPFRPAGEPLRGAVITDFQRSDSTYRVAYTRDGTLATVQYQVSADSVVFVFTDGAGGNRTETYRR